MPREVGPLLEELKRLQRREIDAAREAAASQPVIFEGSPYDADGAAQTRLSAMAAAVAIGIADEPIYWRDAENVTHELTHDQFQELAAVVLGQGQAVFQRSFALKDMIDSAQTSAEVRAVRWNTSIAITSPASKT